MYYIQLEECYSCPITSSPTLSEEPAINFKYIVLIHNGFRPIKPILLFISYTDDSGTTKRLITNLNDLPISASDCYYHKLNITPILSSLLCQDIMNNDGKKYNATALERIKKFEDWCKADKIRESYLIGLNSFTNIDQKIILINQAIKMGVYKE